MGLIVDELLCACDEASRFKKLSRRARSSHCKALTELKEELAEYLPAKKETTYSGKESGS